MADVDQLKKDLWKHMARSPFVMVGLNGEHSEPLTAQLDEDQVDTLWFFVAKDNRLIRGGAATAQLVSTMVTRKKRVIGFILRTQCGPE